MPSPSFPNNLSKINNKANRNKQRKSVFFLKPIYLSSTPTDLNFKTTNGKRIKEIKNVKPIPFGKNGTCGSKATKNKKKYDIMHLVPADHFDKQPNK